MPYIYFLLLNCRFNTKYAFQVHVTAQALSGNVIFILLFIRLLAWKLSCHFLVQGKPFYSTSKQVGNTLQTLFLWFADIQNSVKH